MKLVRVTVRPDLERAPEFLAHLLDSPDVEEARAVDWNRGSSATSTHLYAFDGDPSAFAAAARATEGVESVVLAEPEGTPTYALVELRDEAVEMFGEAGAAIDRSGIVVRRPLSYREGAISGQVVGDPAVLQATVERVPDSLDVRIDEIGSFPSGRTDARSRLSERQREAVETALALGYYDQPRRATHEDVGEAMDCAPNTASDHLQKAEAKLVRAGMDVLGFER